VSGGIVAGEFSIKENSQFIGNSIISIGTTNLTINTPGIKENSKVFITPRTPTKGQTIFVDQIIENESFTVLIEESIDTDIHFDWFIVNID